MTIGHIDERLLVQGKRPRLGSLAFWWPESVPQVAKPRAIGTGVSRRASRSTPETRDQRAVAAAAAILDGLAVPADPTAPGATRDYCKVLARSPRRSQRRPPGISK